MEKVTVEINRPWPTKQGLRRPEQGPISVTKSEADHIVREKAGKIIRQAKAKDEKPEQPKALSSMNKDELLATAKAEKVEKAKNDDGAEIAITDATNPQIIAAIEAVRPAS